MGARRWGLLGGPVPELIEDAAAYYPQLPAVWVERLIGQEAPFVLEMTVPVAAGYAIGRHFDLLDGDDLVGYDGCLPKLPGARQAWLVGGTFVVGARSGSLVEVPEPSGPVQEGAFRHRWPVPLPCEVAVACPDISGETGHDCGVPLSWPAAGPVPARPQTARTGNGVGGTGSGLRVPKTYATRRYS